MKRIFFAIGNFISALEQGEGPKLRKLYYGIFEEIDESLVRRRMESHGVIRDGIVIYDMNGYSLSQVLSPQSKY